MSAGASTVPKSKAFITVGSDPNIGLLSEDEQREYYKKVLYERFSAGKEIQDLALKELKEAIKRAKTTQSWILSLNIIMFFFGIALISIAVYGGFTNMQPIYSVLFGGVGFGEIVASFFIGAMQRSQKSIADLVQVEVSFLNYFEQVSLWEQYASVREEKQIDKANIAEAAKNIHDATVKTLELLQKYVEATT